MSNKVKNQNQTKTFPIVQVWIKTLFVLDVNECAKGTHNCSADAVCSNSKGSYNCTCNPGYYGDGWVCQGKFNFIAKRETSILGEP